MQGLGREGQDTIRDHDDPEVRDAALIAAAQRVEHHEIAGYGTVVTCTRLLGHGDAATLLNTTLHEEGGTDEIFTGLSRGINVEAMLR
ncbi:DUF892 family protein [Deinococcus kurensis]|uniref:DUF892 family protein n=1 Tax=Deinococcus kurensis TaxID=2662757 RepID=UPI003530D23F